MNMVGVFMVDILIVAIVFLSKPFRAGEVLNLGPNLLIQVFFSFSGDKYKELLTHHKTSFF